MYLERLRTNITEFTLHVQAHFVSLVIKRALDIILSFFGLVFLSPLFLLIALAIHRDTPGPVFYRGRRMGKGGREFGILKFRTMYERSESYSGPKVTASDDTRVTPMGHWLRETKINELPQLWNVLVGEMSLVGPRPEDPEITRTWPQALRDEVLSVRPGITSPASVLYRNEETLLCAENLLKKYMEDVGPDKLRLDDLYVRYRSFLLDLDVLFWTFLILIPRLRSFQPPETLLFVGPVTRLIRRYLNWFMIDLMITVVAFSLMAIIWRIYGPLNLGVPKDFIMTLGFALLFSMVEALLGVNRIAWSHAALKDIYDLILAWTISTTLALLVNHEVQGFPLGLVGGASILALFGFILVRYRSRLMVELIQWFLRFQTRERSIRERVLIVGTNQAGQHAAWLLTHPANARKFWLVGFIDNEFLRQGMRLYGANVLGTLKELPALMKKHRASLVLVANHQEYQDDFAFISRVCEQNAVKMVVLPDILTTLGGLAGRGEHHQTGAGSPVWIPETGRGNQPANNCASNPCEHCLMHSDTHNLSAQLIPIKRLNRATWKGRTRRSTR